MRSIIHFIDSPVKNIPWAAKCLFLPDRFFLAAAHAA
jgi:hypothetical protein